MALLLILMRESEALHCSNTQRKRRGPILPLGWYSKLAEIESHRTEFVLKLYVKISLKHSYIRICASSRLFIYPSDWRAKLSELSLGLIECTGLIKSLGSFPSIRANLLFALESECCRSLIHMTSTTILPTAQSCFSSVFFCKKETKQIIILLPCPNSNSRLFNIYH